jgi:CRISPR/Cas system type I-B associated protein Csh2 (Cas7 group RAMP superfamily)
MNKALIIGGGIAVALGIGTLITVQVIKGKLIKEFMAETGLSKEDAKGLLKETGKLFKKMVKANASEEEMEAALNSLEESYMKRACKAA